MSVVRYTIYFRALILVAFVSPLSPAFSQAGSINAIELHDGNLTLSASQISLIDIAQELELLSGIPITAIGNTVKLMDVDIVSEPFAKAIAKISPNHLLVRKSVNEPDTILEVIFMLQDDHTDSGIFNENLPSGEPVQDIIETVDPTYVEQSFQEPTYQENVSTVEFAESVKNEQVQIVSPELPQ